MEWSRVLGTQLLVYACVASSAKVMVAEILHVVIDKDYKVEVTSVFDCIQNLFGIY